MDFVFRFLGIIARFNERCGRYRLHFVMPLNLFVVIVLAGVLCFLYWMLPGTTPSTDPPPLDPAVTILIMILVGLFEIAMIVTACTSYVVFRRTDPHQGRSAWRGAALYSEASVPGPPAQSDMPTGMRATGQFVSESGDRKRFIDMPTSPMPRPEGGTSICSRITFRNTLFGFTTSRNQSYWAIDVPPVEARDCARGFFYLGFSRRPALRFTYTPFGEKRPRSAVLSFNTGDDREIVFQALTRNPDRERVSI